MTDIELAYVVGVCRETAGLKPSPDGLTGDVRNLRDRGDIAERKIKRLEAQLAGAVEETERLRTALRWYADEGNWLNHREVRGFPGFHGRAIAEQALNGDGGQ